MRARKASAHRPPDLAPGDLVNALRAALAASDIPNDEVRIHRRSRTSDGASLERDVAWNDLWSIIDLKEGAYILAVPRRDSWRELIDARWHDEATVAGGG